MATFNTASPAQRIRDLGLMPRYTQWMQGHQVGVYHPSWPAKYGASTAWCKTEDEAWERGVALANEVAAAYLQDHPLALVQVHYCPAGSKSVCGLVNFEFTRDDYSKVTCPACRAVMGMST